MTPHHYAERGRVPFRHGGLQIVTPQNMPTCKLPISTEISFSHKAFKLRPIHMMPSTLNTKGASVEKSLHTQNREGSPHQSDAIQGHAGTAEKSKVIYGISNYTNTNTSNETKLS